MPKHGVPIRVLRVLRSSERFEPLTLSERQANRRRRIPDNLRPDFAAFSCNTQSIPSKKRLHQDKNSLEICSRWFNRRLPESVPVKTDSTLIISL